MDTDPTLEPLGPAELHARIEQQDRVLAEQQREVVELRDQLYRQDRVLREARAILVLVLESRVYRLMRALGRWAWLEHRIRRVLR